MIAVAVTDTMKVTVNVITTAAPLQLDDSGFSTSPVLLPTKYSTAHVS